MQKWHFKAKTKPWVSSAGVQEEGKTGIWFGKANPSPKIQDKGIIAGKVQSYET